MSTILIKKATVADPRSSWNGQTVDIYIREGKLASIAPDLSPEATVVIEAAALFVSPGFTDIFSHFHDPGHEEKETLETGALAAAAGGYTRVLVLPNTQPTVHSKSQVEYILHKNAQLSAQVHPMGAITRNCEGKELAEMYDMQQSGAVAFTDGLRPLQNSQVMLKALQYVKAFHGVVVQIPDDTHLSRHGLIHEGLVSTQLGLPGKPALAETLMLSRDIELLRYTGSRLHVTGISTAASIELIRRAKNDGLDITCSVTPYHLWFTDIDLAGYDTYLKVNPPLRTKHDREALRQAITDGTIDCIASHHQPHEWDSKVCEFEYAQYGMEGLETAVAATRLAIPDLSATRMTELFALGPSKIFGLPCPLIETNEIAQLSLYSVAEAPAFAKEKIISKSKNNAFTGLQMPLRIIGTVRHDIFCGM